MPEELRMRVGDRSRLKAQVDLLRWTCDQPEVVSVSDVDVVRGMPGGLLHARKAGRARVQGIAPDNSAHICVDVIVEGGPPVTALAVGESGQLPLPEGIAHCSTPQTQVAEVSDNGRVRAIGPGIVAVTCTGAGGLEAEFQVRVSGALDIQAGQSLSLANRIGTQVSRWRTGSSSIATIVQDGTVTASSRGRTTPVFVTLQDGDEFSFDLRVREPERPGPSHRPAQPERGPTAPNLARSAVPPDPIRLQPSTAFDVEASPPGEVPRDPQEAAAARREELDTHLARFDDLVQQQRWEDAEIMLPMADIVASGHEDLQAMVRESAARLERGKRDQAASAWARVVFALRNKEYGRLKTSCREVPRDAESSELARTIVDLAEQVKTMEDTRICAEERIRKLLHAGEAAWQAAARQRMTPVLAELAELLADWSIEEMAPAMVDTIESMSGWDASMDNSARIIAVLADLGEPGVHALLERLAQPARTGHQWVMYALREIGMDKVANTIAAFYAHQDARTQKQMVSRLVDVAKQSPEDFMALLAGGLRRLPMDRRLADALTSYNGRNQTEELAVKLWSVSRLPAARIVLERLFEYDRL